jgi:hypothetical protein
VDPSRGIPTVGRSVELGAYSSLQQRHAVGTVHNEITHLGQSDAKSLMVWQKELTMASILDLCAGVDDARLNVCQNLPQHCRLAFNLCISMYLLNGSVRTSVDTGSNL